jgi:hypothetical protein
MNYSDVPKELNYKQLKNNKMSETTITLDGAQKEVDPKAVYLIDFSKLESVNDLVLIMSALGISFSPTHPHFELIKRFANLDNPIYPNQGIPLQKPEDVKLPKLKKLD